MRHQATLEQPVHTEDYEGLEEEWEDVGVIRFSIKTTQGSDSDSDQQIDHVRRYDIRTRWRPDISPNMRLNFNGRLLNFVGLPIDTDQRTKWLDITCEELVV